MYNCTTSSPSTLPLLVTVVVTINLSVFLIAVADNFKFDTDEKSDGLQGIRITETSSGLCAQTIFTGPYPDLNIAYNWLYHQYIVNKGREPGPQPALEEYLNDPRNTHPTKLQTAVSIPLKA